MLELPGQVATRYCGRLFAQLGAEVTAVGERDDDSLGYTGDAGRAYGSWLDAGKSRALAVSEAGGTYDLVIAGQDAEAIALADASITELWPHPRPVLLAISWFDATGPYASWPVNDEIIHALDGVAFSFGEAPGPPMLPQGHTPQVMAGACGFNAGLAALLALPEHRPRRVDVNVFESVMCLSEVGTIVAIDDERARSLRLGVNRFSPTYPCTSYRTSDGWVGVTCLTPPQWAAMGAVIERPDLVAATAYSTAFRRLMRGDEIDDALAPAFLLRTTDEWVEIGKARRIPIAPMVGPGELAAVDHWRARGSFAPVDGTNVVAPTLPMRVTPDGHALPRWTPRPDTAGPLSGVVVLDFSMGWAGPQATRYLGDLGADVIKIESDEHPDWYRGWEARQGGDPPPYETRSSFNTLNRNKRGVVLDLESESGLALAKRLVAQADVVIENFAAGVLDKLGLSPDVQRALKPGLVTVSMPAFGSTGSLAGVRAYGSTVEQASGMPFVNGHEHWPPSLQHVAFGDPVGGIYAVTAVLAALAARPRLGGVHIDLSQVECLFDLNADAIVAEQVAGRPLPRTGSRRSRGAPSCVVATAADGGWLAVSVDSDAAWHGLCRVLEMTEWPDDPILATVDGRNRNADLLEKTIAEWAALQTASDAAGRLRAHGVPAAAVQPGSVLGRDPQLRAAAFWETMDRRYVGAHTLGAPAFRFDGVRPVARRPAPTLGEHTAEVIAELK